MQEFDPEEFYQMLEMAEDRVKIGAGMTTELPKYIISQLGLTKDPLGESLLVDGVSIIVIHLLLTTEPLGEWLLGRWFIIS